VLIGNLLKRSDCVDVIDILTDGGLGYTLRYAVHMAGSLGRYFGQAGRLGD